MKNITIKDLKNCTTLDCVELASLVGGFSISPSYWEQKTSYFPSLTTDTKLAIDLKDERTLLSPAQFPSLQDPDPIGKVSRLG
jgi:hypothetical protein